MNGMKIAQKMDGVSLLPGLQGKTSGRKSIYIQYDGNGSLGSAQRCVIKENYKLMLICFKMKNMLSCMI